MELIFHAMARVRPLTMKPLYFDHLPDFDHLGRTFALAYFIHRRAGVAHEITLEALARVEILAEAQDKRRYYRPTDQRSRPHRSRVSMTKSQLLQRLVYNLSEPYERRQEAANDFEQDDMTVRFIVYLARICLRRNAFHVALGLTRLLHSYSSREAMAMYHLIIQDPERFREPDYFRARKKRLLEEVCQRFAPLLEPRRGTRGERLFELRAVDERLEDLVRRTLELVAPWETSCVIPERLRPDEEELEAFCFRGSQPDDEHPIEMRRIHSLLHPPCFARLTTALEMAPPAERLNVPLFGGALFGGALFGGARGTEEDGEERGDRDRPPRLEDDKRSFILGELKRRERLRRRVSAASLRIRVDAAETACWEPERESRVRLGLDEGAELVEVVGREAGEDVLLAVYLLPFFEANENGAVADGAVADGAAMARRTAWVRLTRGARIGFALLAEPGGFAVEIRYQERRLWCAIRHLARSLANNRRGPAWRPATALVLLVLVATGAGMLIIQPPERPEPFAPPPTRGHLEEFIEPRRLFVDLFDEDSSRQEWREELARSLADHGLTVVDEYNEADIVLSLDGLLPTLRRRGVQGEILWQGTLSGSAEEAAARIAEVVQHGPPAPGR